MATHHMDTQLYQARPHSSVRRARVHKRRTSSVRKLGTCISLPCFMFGRALSWGSAFAVRIVYWSLVYKFEHSSKVLQAWFKVSFDDFSLISDSSLTSRSSMGDDMFAKPSNTTALTYHGR